jgi:hypothetical protein
MRRQGAHKGLTLGEPVDFGYISSPTNLLERREELKRIRFLVCTILSHYCQQNISQELRITTPRITANVPDSERIILLCIIVHLVLAESDGQGCEPTKPIFLAISSKKFTIGSILAKGMSFFMFSFKKKKKGRKEGGE